MNCLIAKNLKKSYLSRDVVKDFSLKVCQGEVVGLLGSNGAGKSTSFYMIVGLIQSDFGEVELDGKNITNDPLHIRSQKGIGYLPQEASIFRDLTVRENIFSALENRKLPWNKKKNLLQGLLEDFELVKIQDSKGSSLSGGERRRVEIARALAIEPRFMLLDEPFAGVDPLATQGIQDIIKKLKKRNIGVLITDHNVRETLGIIDRAYIMNDGKLLTDGTPEQIINDEKARKFYLGEEFKI